MNATPLATVLALSVGIGSTAAPEAPIPELEAARQTFEAKVRADVTPPYDAALLELNVSYSAALQRAQETAQQGGLLEDALALKAERELVARGEAVPETDASTTPATLHRLRDTYRASLAKVTAQREARLAPLREAHLMALTELSRSLTREGKLEAAVAVAAEAKRLAAPVASVASSPTDDEDFSGRWELIRPGADAPLAATMTRLPDTADSPPRYRMTGGALGGVYEHDRSRLTKVKEAADPYWDISWSRRGGAWVNLGSHYSDWELKRPAKSPESK